ncbi:MAG: four helix bundle protein [Rickettsiales bacterium]
MTIKNFRDLEVWQVAMQLAETETQIILAFKFGYLTQNEYSKIEELIIRVRKMTNALRTALLRKIK